MAKNPPPPPAQWKFAATGEGPLFGATDASVEHFAGNALPNAVREVIQNSLDAATRRGDQPQVNVTFEYIEIDRNDFNGSELYSHVESSYNNLHESNNTNIDNAKWMSNGLELLKRDFVPCLKIIETGTTGLTKEHWEALVDTEGVAYKTIDNPGGSFGIGKTAVFALSDLRSVIYSTLYVNGLKEGRVEKAGGKARLITHPDPKNPKEKLQHIGFWRSIEGTREPIKGNKIPDIFRLSITGSTGIYILGCQLSENWISQILEAVAGNFFAAIHRKELTVTIIDKERIRLDYETLDSIFAKSQSHDKKLSKRWEYYKSLRDSKPTPISTPNYNPENLPDGFKVRAYFLLHDDSKSPRGIATINRKGMLITDSNDIDCNPFAIRSNSTWNPFSLLIEPANNQTDNWLRQLEDPAHKCYDIGRAPSDQQHRIRKMFLQIRRDITKLIDEKMGVGKTEIVNVGALSHLLPDINISDDNAKNRKRTILEVSSRPRSHLHYWPDNEPVNTELDDDLEDDINEPPDNPDNPNPHPPGPNDPDPIEIVTDPPTPTEREHRRSSIIYPRVLQTGDTDLRISFTVDLESLPDDGIARLNILPQGDKLRREPTLTIVSVSPEEQHPDIKIYINSETQEVYLEKVAENIKKPMRVSINVKMSEEARHIMSLTPGYIVEAR